MFAVLLGRPERHGFEAFEGRDALLRANLDACARNPVRRRPEHEHLVQGRHHRVGVVGGPQTRINGVAHRAHVHGLLFATVLDVRFSKVVGVQRVKRWANLVLHEQRNLVLARELRVDGCHVAVFAQVASSGERMCLQQ